MIQLFNNLTQISIYKIECLTIVDDGIKQTSKVAEELWNFDRKTSYIVSSFRSLFLSWGSGIASNPENLELDIIDIPAMISALLDISIPANSMGRIPIEALTLTSKQKSEAKTANAKQLHQIVLNYEKYYHRKNLLTKSYQGLDSQGLIYLKKNKFRYNVLQRYFKYILLNRVNYHLGA